METATLKRTDFTVEDAARAASEAVELKVQEQIAEVLEDGVGAKGASRAYAEHLAGGGSPVEIPGRAGTDVTLDRLGQRIVYRLWNVARGSRNPISPFSGSGKWRVAEALFDRLGEPITYAELCAIWKDGSTFGTKPASEEMGRILLGIEGEQETVVGRRTKVGGKVAYFLRDRREGDPDVGSYRYDEIPEERP